jgi:hypothetical protein
MIEQYLKQHSLPVARFTISNPTYIRLGQAWRTLQAGYNPGYYTQTLNQELQRYLSALGLRSGAREIVPAERSTPT